MLFTITISSSDEWEFHDSRMRLEMRPCGITLTPNQIRLQDLNTGTDTSSVCLPKSSNMRPLGMSLLFSMNYFTTVCFPVRSEMRSLKTEAPLHGSLSCSRACTARSVDLGPQPSRRKPHLRHRTLGRRPLISASLHRYSTTHFPSRLCLFSFFFRQDRL